MTSPVAVYPLASPSEDYIPLDIIRSEAAAMLDISTTASNSLALPAGITIAILTSTTDAIARLGVDIVDPVSGTFYSEAIWLPANTAVTLLLREDTLYARSVDIAGHIKIQLCTKWNSLGLAAQFQRR